MGVGLIGLVRASVMGGVLIRYHDYNEEKHRP